MLRSFERLISTFHPLTILLGVVGSTLKIARIWLQERFECPSISRLHDLEPWTQATFGVNNKAVL